METVIKFKFKQPFGLVLGKGERTFTFTPKLARRPTTAPGIVGTVWVEDIDFDYVYEIKLASEMPRDLAPHIASRMDPGAAAAFRAAQAEEAANNHAHANVVRDGLNFHAERGAIEIISDSFQDSLADVVADVPAPRKPGRPKKAVEA
jgi:hypothetical protein